MSDTVEFVMTSRQHRNYWKRVQVTDGCWEWTGWRNESGYGRWAIGPSKFMAYHVSYRLMVGPVPKGLELDHLCSNRACVNPAHLEAVTHEENMARGQYATKTHCVNGHEFSADNLLKPHGGHRRVCKACAADRRRVRRERAAA